MPFDSIASSRLVQRCTGSRAAPLPRPTLAKVLQWEESLKWISSFPSTVGRFLGGPLSFHLMGITGNLQGSSTGDWIETERGQGSERPALISWCSTFCLQECPSRATSQQFCPAVELSWWPLCPGSLGSSLARFRSLVNGLYPLWRLFYGCAWAGKQTCSPAQLWNMTCNPA